MKIITSERARADLEEIFEYIARDSVHNAVAIVDRVTQAIDSLSLFANRGRRAMRREHESWWWTEPVAWSSIEQDVTTCWC